MSLSKSQAEALRLIFRRKLTAAIKAARYAQEEYASWIKQLKEK